MFAILCFIEFLCKVEEKYEYIIKKILQSKNNFMFAAVMSEEENCKGFLERALSIQIDHVEISTEKKYCLSSGI